jgi:NlpC/P60 family/Putative peptidoglycan binding domain
VADDGLMAARGRRRQTPLLLACAVATLLAVPATLATAAESDKPYLSDSVPVARGCITLDREWAGVKVWLVQRRLGTTHERERYGPDTADAVRAFQQRKGLKVTGRVNERTWEALRLGRPFCMDRFTVQPEVEKPASPRKRIETMIRWAEDQVGRRYIWGGAGPIGYDCSGLSLQAMYAGGRVVPAVTTYLHQRQDFATASTLYTAGMRRVPLDERRRGDLIFYGPKGSVTHMAIYLGRGRVVEAVRPEVQTASMWNHGVPVKPRVVRPFGR